MYQINDFFPLLFLTKLFIFYPVVVTLFFLHIEIMMRLFILKNIPPIPRNIYWSLPNSQMGPKNRTLINPKDTHLYYIANKSSVFSFSVQMKWEKSFIYSQVSMVTIKYAELPTTVVELQNLMHTFFCAQIIFYSYMQTIIYS